MNEIITYLSFAIDNATYVDLFSWTLLMLPLLFAVPVTVYWLIFKPLEIIRQLL